MPDNLTWEAGSEAEVQGTGTPIEGFSFSLEDVSIHAQIEEQPELVLQAQQLTFETQYDGLKTFDGLFSYVFPDGEIAIGNLSSRNVSNQSVLDTLRKDSNKIAIWDDEIGNFLSDDQVRLFSSKIDFQKINEGPAGMLVQFRPNKTNPDFLTDGVYDPEKWKKYLSAIEKGNQFLSCPYRKNVPYGHKEYEKYGVTPRRYVDFIPSYNFLDKKYEENAKYADELSLSNAYAMIDGLSLGQKINPKEKPEAQRQVKNTFENIIFSRGEFLDYQRKVEDFKLSFPMSIDIKISSPEELVLEPIMSKVDVPQIISQNELLAGDQYLQDCFETTFEKSNLFSSNIFKEAKAVKTKIIPLFSMLQSRVNNGSTTIFGKAEDVSKTSSILKDVIAVRLAEKPNLFRSVKQIFESVPCISEVLAYRISKKTTSGTKLQDIFIPALSKAELSYFDSQIKYSKEYTYSISAYMIVYASCYTYRRHALPPGSGYSDDDSAWYMVSTQPAVVITETPYISEEIFVFDSPPVHPFADFIQYEKDSRKFLINIQQNSGIYEEHPFAFPGAESEIISKIRRYQRRTKQGDKIIFKSDDPLEKVQIFKSSSPFQNRVDYTRSVILTLEQTSSFVDSIPINQKFYYRFRSFDYHKNFSNMSPIYEIIMRSVNNSVFLEVRLYEPEKKIPSFKQFRRYLMIDGAFEQTLLNFEKTGLKYIAGNETRDESEILGKTAKQLSTAPAYGQSEDSVFGDGRSFRIKVRSKSSGKTFSVILKFGTQHIK